ncbi:MAG: HD domain-containing protein [Anaerolineales bacterium]|jgi:uncharacterized protein
MLNLELARDWYPQDDPVHGFDHVLRVYHLVGLIAETENADLEIVRAAALLHDAQGDKKTEGEKTQNKRKQHHMNSAEYAEQILEKEGWSKERINAVQHCIRAHRFRDNNEQPQTLEAKVLFDADKLDAIGAVGVIRAVAFAVRNGQALFTLPSDQFMMSGMKEPDEPHTPYHEFLYKLRHLKERLYTTTAQKLAEKRHRIIEDFFEQLATEVEIDPYI